MKSRKSAPVPGGPAAGVGGPLTLCVDIGGTGIKTLVVGPSGKAHVDIHGNLVINLS